MYIHLILYFVITIFSVSAFDKYGKCFNSIDSVWEECTDHLLFTSNPQINDLNKIPNPSDISHVGIFLDVNATKVVLFPSKIFEQFPSLEYVKMFNVGMERLEKESLRNANSLSELHLEVNKIKKIPANVTILAPRLAYLSLEGNKISEIEEYAFNSLSLQTLYLDGNNIKTVKRTYFSHALMLEFIDLSNNVIENIEERTFDLPKLKYLWMNGNKLKTLPLNLFANAPSLFLLGMNRNRLTSETVPALLKARTLAQLHLGNNPTLNGSNLLAVTELPYIHTLDLSRCRLTDEIIRSFQKMPTLKKLYIRSNNLSDINLLHHLSQHNNLELIDISENIFTKLDAFDRIRSIFPLLREIVLSYNKWDCAWAETVKNTGESFDC